MSEPPTGAVPTTEAGRHLLYIADPMCSWCYGFAPVMAAVTEQLDGRVPIHVIMGGLRPGETRPQRAKDMDYLRRAWAHVGQISGQSFDAAFFEREGFVYDTEPPSRAVVTIRHVYPEAALPFLERLSLSFYAGNRDITDAAVIGDIAAEAGFDRAEFLAAFSSDAAREQTLKDFTRCQTAGIRGFPTLLGGSAASGYSLLTHGFCGLDVVQQELGQWLGEDGPTV